MLDRPLDDFRADPKARDLSLFYRFLAIQECIDLAAHWVADEGWGEPDDAGSAFDILADRGAITRESATALRGATGLRNRIAHGYAQLDAERRSPRKIGRPGLLCAEPPLLNSEPAKPWQASRLNVAAIEAAIDARDAVHLFDADGNRGTD